MKSEYRQILTFLLCIVIFVSNAEASKHILKEKKPFDDDEIDHGEVIRGERSEERINLSVPGECSVQYSILTRAATKN